MLMWGGVVEGIYKVGIENMGYEMKGREIE